MTEVTVTGTDVLMAPSVQVVLTGGEVQISGDSAVSKLVRAALALAATDTTVVLDRVTTVW